MAAAVAAASFSSVEKISIKLPFCADMNTSIVIASTNFFFISLIDKLFPFPLLSSL